MSMAKNKQNRKHPSIKEYSHNRKSVPILIVLVFLLIISTLGILVTSGLESTLLGITVTPTDGKVYLLASCSNNSNSCPEEIKKAREQHNGKEIGTIRSPQPREYYEISSSVVSDFLITNLDSVPEDKIPVLVPDNINPDELNPRFIPVGVYVGSIFREFDTLDAGIFAPILSQIMTQNKPVYLINDNTDKIEKFLLEEWSRYNDNTEDTNVGIDELLECEGQVIVFDSYRQALDFQRDADNIQYATVNDIFGDTLAIDYVFHTVLTIQYWITGFIALLTIAAAVDVILYLHSKPKQSSK